MATADKQVRAAEIALGIQSSYPEILFSLVDCNPDQPRQDFDDDGDIVDLARNIKANSLLQAVTVQHHPTISGRYMIVAGERRFRAMKHAGMTKAVFKLIEGPGVKRSYILSAIENLHRVNLNPIEEALAYQRLHDEEHLSWEEIHDLTGRDVSVILNKIKLLTFPAEIQQRVRRGELPQVTALNLSQWRNEEGDYLRMAHDLIAGRDSAEVHFRKETVHGQRLVQAKLPKTPEEFAKRIVKLSGHVQSMPVVLEAFLQLTFDEQSEVFDAIHYSVRGKLRVRFIALYRAIQAVSERMNAFDAVQQTEHESPAVEVPDLPPVPIVASTSHPLTPTLAPKPVAASPAPISPARQAIPRFSPPPAIRPAASARPSPVLVPAQPMAPKPQVATPTTSVRGVQSWDLSTRVLAALFYSGGRRKVNLSRSELVKTLGDFLPKGADIDIVVNNTLIHMRAKWRAPQKGNMEERYFTSQVALFRKEYGSLDDIEDAFDKASEEDRSGDPIDL